MANSVCSAATAVNSSCILSALDHYARRGSGKYEKEALHTASKRACRPASGLEAGLWLEFGVAHGGSTKIILQHLTRSTCSVSRKKLYAFDSFLGLPETWRQPDAHVRGGENISRCCLGAGAFARKGLPPFHNPNVEWRIGWVRGFKHRLADCTAFCVTLSQPSPAEPSDLPTARSSTSRSLASSRSLSHRPAR